MDLILDTEDKMKHNLLASKQASKQARLNYLDFYKGMAILFIIITHYAWTSEQRLQLLFPFWIDMAVPIFMVITGYVTALSFQKRGQDLKRVYKPEEILCKWLRFIIPFFPVYVLQIIARVVIGHEYFTVLSALKAFIVGGTGPGSYYFPVMLQVVVIIPVLWEVITRFEVRGLIICFIANIVFEVFKTIINLNPEIYRLCSLRYIFIIAYGIYLYEMSKRKNEKKIWYYILGIIGVVYIVVFKYTTIDPVITSQWTTTSVFAVLFIVPIMMHLMKWSEIHNMMIELLGKASFNIFLVQMVYYWSIGNKINEIVPTIPLRLATNITICCVFGVVFYKIESPVTQTIVKAIRGK